MLSLPSKTYSGVSVYLRDDETYTLPADKGLQLMDYLTGDVQTKHVKLNDTGGNVIVVLITDIKKVQPIEASMDMNDLTERFLHGK